MLLAQTLELEADHSYAVKAERLDRSGEVTAGGYYVYCRRESRRRTSP